MAWEKTGEHIDEAQGLHVITLEDRSSNPPAKHLLMIHIGHDSCPTCGHVRPKDNVDELDPRAHTKAMLAELQGSMDQIRAYGKKHKVAGKKA